ncbi:iron ABC transporter permease [Corynebacterium sp. TAE3-ERU30]|uniref:FecCD family ABC transporter permease n=1 Tax=Corynebacterium sp. TAE3-ERU30 TaxID=2849496 RepID=UPI001C43C81F|nr:iron ABC transporter permease [Corynebacterium sp. TAE3-ERU30]
MCMRLRRLAGLGFLGLLLLASVVTSLFFGARTIPFAAVSDSLQAWLGGRGVPSGVDPIDAQVIRELRAPRTLLGIAVGLALGAAGAIIQGLTRNPLADPGILGISPGASLAVVLSFAVLGPQSIYATAGWAFVGAGLATLAIFTVAALGGGRINPLTLILGGAALSAVLNSITGSMVLFSDAHLNVLRLWTVGSIAGRSMDFVTTAAPILVLLAFAASAIGPTLNLLNLGDDAARALGANPERSRAIGMVLIALLAGVATSVAGPIGFAALIVPHIARTITGPDYRWIIPYSALCGAVLLLSADVVGRVIARPGELEVGIVLAFVGAPFFIAIMARKKVSRL